MGLFHSNDYSIIVQAAALCSTRLKFSKIKIAMLKKILGMLRAKIERESAPMIGGPLCEKTERDRGMKISGFVDLD